MYKKACGIIETLAPLHTGATSGEESGNLNLIFRDQFTQTGIIPGSSIRGRLRSEMRLAQKFAEKNGETQEQDEASYWYGRGNEQSRQKNINYESIVKIEHASVVWLPVFCPGQPIVWVSCPRLLERYGRIAGIEAKLPKPYTGSPKLRGRKLKQKKKKNKQKEVIFFNLGFLTIEHPQKDLSPWFPLHKGLPAVVFDNVDMGMIHDMALYRQSRVALAEEQKIAADKAFFNTEALPEGTLLAFPLALRPTEKTWVDWHPLGDDKQGDIYLGGLESIGFGHCYVTLQEV